MQGAGKPELLIKHQHSAHHFAFRPSHFRILKRADLVIWIDRNFESGFQKLPEILPQATVRLELLRLLDLQNQDGHIWYSPTQLRKMVLKITQALSRLDPAQQSLFWQNQQKMLLAIDAWETSTREQLAGQRLRYLLDHNFLLHFESDFKVKALATINDRHGQHGGIQTLRTIEETLTRTPAKCLLANEASISKTGRNLANQFNLTVYPLTIDANAGPGKFMQHLHHLSEVLRACGT